jgi:mRNA-degrading endonuclease YafQ of YafQ-DinJ toxin-antitoxin module
MKIEVQKSFEKDVKKIRDKQLAGKVLSAIEKIEVAATLSEIASKS